MVGLAACAENAVAPTRHAAPSNRSSDVTAATTLETFYGPERFTRERGAPQQITRSISTLRFEAPFVLHVRSGDAAGTNAVTSGSIRFNGQTLISESDFKQRGGEWTFNVTPGTTASLEVNLASAPGSFVDVWLEGKRSDAIFCPSGERGAYTDLSAAIAASRDNGTVLVCDGEHLVDAAHVTRPVTIRSEHPHGATILDADQPTAGLQAGRPSIWIDNVPSGLVRIVDLTFRPQHRAIITQGTFDQVALDSITVIGTNTATTVAWTGGSSTVAGAKVEVTNSHFEHLTLGLFAVSPVEADMLHNTFDDFTGGGVYFSGNTGITYGSGRAEYNHFTRCGPTGCVRALFAGDVVISHNVLDLTDGASRSPAAMIVTRSPDVTVRTPMIVEDNDIIGVAPTGDPNVVANWSTPVGIQITDAAGVVDVVRNNRISYARVGVSIQADLDMRDNSVSNAALGFRTTATRTVTVQRNDFTGLLNSFNVSLPLGPSNFQCNYWGSTTGPHNAPGVVAASVYTPFATAPIANTTNSCP